MVFQRSMLNWRRWGGVNLPWLYVHCAIYETDLMSWFSQRSMLDWRRGGGIVLYMKLVWYNGFAEIYG